MNTPRAQYFRVLLNAVPGYNLWRERVGIYARAVFMEASDIKGAVEENAQPDPSPSKKIEIGSVLGLLKKAVVQQVETHTKHSDAQRVSIFSIIEVCGRTYPPDRLTLKLLDALRPTSFDDASDSEQLEIMYLRFARMKVTHKLQQLKVDKAVMFESLASGERAGDQMPLSAFFGKMGSQYSVFFSNQEQVAVRNSLFPAARDEDPAVSGQRMVTFQGPRSLASLIVSEAEYNISQGQYTVSMLEFVAFCQLFCHSFKLKLEKVLEDAFLDMDAFLKRGAVNRDQFFRILHELNLSCQTSFNSNEDRVFAFCLELELDKKL